MSDTTSRDSTPTKELVYVLDKAHLSNGDTPPPTPKEGEPGSTPQPRKEGEDEKHAASSSSSAAAGSGGAQSLEVDDVPRPLKRLKRVVEIEAKIGLMLRKIPGIDQKTIEALADTQYNAEITVAKLEAKAAAAEARKEANAAVAAERKAVADAVVALEQKKEQANTLSADWTLHWENAAGVKFGAQISDPTVILQSHYDAKAFHDEGLLVPWKPSGDVERIDHARAQVKRKRDQVEKWSEELKRTVENTCRDIREAAGEAITWEIREKKEQRKIDKAAAAKAEAAAEAAEFGLAAFIPNE